MTLGNFKLAKVTRHDPSGLEWIQQRKTLRKNEKSKRFENFLIFILTSFKNKTGSIGLQGVPIKIGK